MEPLFPDLLVLIRGAGDLASGVAYRLVKAGFPVILLERPAPLFVRRTVSYGNAIFAEGSYQVEDIEAVLVAQPGAALALAQQGRLPIMIDENGRSLPLLAPQVVVDARMQKNSLDTHMQAAPLVIGLGPGYTVGVDCHAVIETNRGHSLGRVIWQGAAMDDTGTPGVVSGYAAERVLRAPGAGFILPAPGVEIGVFLEQGALIATLNDKPISAPFPGILRGLIHPSVAVWDGLKIGDLDPRKDPSLCYTISDKALAIGGGVVEAVLSAASLRQSLIKNVVISNAPV